MTTGYKSYKEIRHTYKPILKIYRFSLIWFVTRLNFCYLSVTCCNLGSNTIIGNIITWETTNNPNSKLSSSNSLSSKVYDHHAFSFLTHYSLHDHHCDTMTPMRLKFTTPNRIYHCGFYSPEKYSLFLKGSKIGYMISFIMLFTNIWSFILWQDISVELN